MISEKEKDLLRMLDELEKENLELRIANTNAINIIKNICFNACKPVGCEDKCKDKDCVEKIIYGG